MRERVHVKDLTTLFICPSRQWRTIERKALADCLYLRDCGGNPILFCLKGSILDKEAEKLDLQRIYYSGRKLKRLFDLRYIRDMRQILDDNRFDIVHCYSLDFIWGLCFLLLPNPRVPLLLTFNQYLHHPQKSLWQRWLFRRVDMVLTFSETTKEIAEETLPVSVRRVKIAGGGIEHVTKNLREEKPVKRLGCIISTEEDYACARVALYALQGLLPQVFDLGIKLEFIIYIAANGQRGANGHQGAKLRNLAKALGLEELVAVKNCPAYEPVFKHTDIFIGTSFTEPFNDFEIMAILSRVPVIFPRSASRQLVLFQYKWVGESYSAEDARELKSKLLKLLINEQVYLNELQDSHEELKDLHGIEPYFQRVIGFYERLYAKRLRYLKHRENLNIS